MDKRYQRGNQNPYIEEEQTTQWPKDTKGAIRIRISKKNRQDNGQKIPKGQSKSVYRRRTDKTMFVGSNDKYIYNEPQKIVFPFFQSLQKKIILNTKLVMFCVEQVNRLYKFV
jgi:hypothetical protein